MMKFASFPEVILPFAAFGLLAGCAGSIDVAGLTARLVVPASRPVLLDVRSGGEYAAGHLPGAVNLPVHVLPFRLSEVPVNTRRQPVMVYCAHGPRAGLAGFFLRLAGFSEVLHLQGDVRAWLEAGRPLATGPEPGAFAN